MISHTRLKKTRLHTCRSDLGLITILYRLSRGDTEIAFSLQSTVKPLIYGFVLNDLSPEVVHKYVGQEPSGRSFNELTLDYQSK